MTARKKTDEEKAAEKEAKANEKDAAAARKEHAKEVVNAGDAPEPNIGESLLEHAEEVVEKTKSEAIEMDHVVREEIAADVDKLDPIVEHNLEEAEKVLKVEATQFEAAAEADYNAIVPELEKDTKAAKDAVKADAKKAKAEAKVAVQAVKNYVWKDFEDAGVSCPTSDGSIPGHHAFAWHAPNTPQEIINEMGVIFIQDKDED